MKHYECSNYGKRCSGTLFLFQKANLLFQLTECDYVSGGYILTSLEVSISFKLGLMPKRLLRKQRLLESSVYT